MLKVFQDTFALHPRLIVYPVKRLVNLIIRLYMKSYQDTINPKIRIPEKKEKQMLTECEAKLYQVQEKLIEAEKAAREARELLPRKWSEELLARLDALIAQIHVRRLTCAVA
jgi:hypothetical protein